MTRTEIFEALISHLPENRHSIVIGARQIGKTTIIRQLETYLLKKKLKAFYITLEEPLILKALDEHPENIFRYTIHPDDLTHNDRMYLLIDEVQYAQNPTNFLKLLYDKFSGKVKIIATGSSAFYINRDFKDSLAGRKKIFELYTLNFEEFLHFKSEDKLIAEWQQLRRRPDYQSLKRKELDNLFDEYMIYGGYPAVVLETSNSAKIDLLKDLVNSHMKKDALEADIKEELKYFNLVRILADQVGNLVNQNELANTLKLSVGTIDNYLYLLRKSFHIHLLPPKYGNLRKELVKMPKVYFNDLGLRNIICNQLQHPVSQRSDKGQLLENFVFIRLRQQYGTDSLRYWRTADGNEVDFIVEDTLYTGKAYEVKYNDTQYKPSKFKKFMNAYSGFPLRPVSFETNKPETIELIRL